MKIIVSIFCWLLTIFSLCFPFMYFKSNADIKEVKLSHILVETQEQAQELKTSIDNGAVFEELAEKHSLCPSKVNKGNLGYIMKGRLQPEIDKVAFIMPKNSVSEPVKSKDGWHILKVYDISYYSDKENFVYKYDIDKLLKDLQQN